MTTEQIVNFNGGVFYALLEELKREEQLNLNV